MAGISESSEIAAMELYEEALERPPEEREQFIAAKPGMAPSVRALAREMLLADDKGYGSLRTGGAGSLSREDEPMPERLGAYRLLRLLGRGGMGAVYLAERASDDFEHVVAIKVIKTGLLSDPLIERFRRERQILANLNHPHIAHLMDGGENEHGAPYIVMEFVDGVPLAQWIAEQTPSLQRRIDLFLQICDAVEFAHQNLVIHRDLTPSNVMVKQGDNAKLIDFGIARPQVDNDDAAGGSTFSGLSLTPGFAAPERKAGEAANTLTDIYSLGRILGVLLEGHDERELTAIAAKASHEDPDQRYATARGIAEDIDNYRQGYPVTAYASGKRYRFAKFVVRQRLAVGAIAAVILLLIVGIAATGWAYQRAELARADAERRFAQVRDLSNFMLFDLYDDLQPVSGNTRALTRIADTSRSYLDALHTVATGDVDLGVETALGYKRLSDVLGNPEGPNLGRRADAAAAIRRSVSMLEALHREYPDNPKVIRALAQANYALSIFIFIAEDKSLEAIPSAKRAGDLYGSLIASGKSQLADRVGRIEALLQAAKPLVWENRGKEAIAQIEALRKTVDPLAEQHPGDRAVLMAQARTYSTLSSAMSWYYKPDDPHYIGAIPLSAKAIEVYAKLDKAFPDDRDIRNAQIAGYYNRALVFYDLELWQAAHDDLRKAETIAKAMLAADPDDSGMARRLQTIQGQLAPILVELKSYAEAIAMAEQVLVQREALLRREPDNPGYFRDRASAFLALADTQASAGRSAEGCASYRKASADWKVIARRWGVSALNQSNDVDYINDKLAQCAR